MTSSTAAHPSDSGHADVLQSNYGYKQELKRTLRPLSIFGVSFSYMSITGAVFASFGIGLASLGTASLLFWPIAIVGQVFVALVIAELASRIPLAGYSYQWGGRLIATGYGYVVAIVTAAFLVAAAGTLSYVLAAPFIETLLGIPETATTSALIATIIVILCVAINIIGVGIFAKFNNAAVICEVLATLGITAAVLVAVFVKGTPHTPLYSTGGPHSALIWGGVLGALTMGMWSLCGFESAADLSEEVSDPKAMPKAILGSVVGAGIIGFLCMSGLSFGIKNLKTTAGAASPTISIIAGTLGTTATRVLMLFPLIAVLGSTLATITVLSRLVFALGRDNVTPGAGMLKRVHAGRKTPGPALIVSGVLALALIWYAALQPSAFEVFIGATAILPYLLYLMLIIAYGVRRRGLAYLNKPGMFTLGKYGLPVIVVAACWSIFALLVLTVPSEFHQAAEIVAVILIAAGVWYLVGFRGRVRRGEAGVTRLQGNPGTSSSRVQEAIERAEGGCNSSGSQQAMKKAIE